LDEEEFGIVDAPAAGGSPAKTSEEEVGVETKVDEPVVESTAATAAAVEPPVAKEEEVVAAPASDVTAQVAKEEVKEENVPKVTAEMSFKERMGKSVFLYY